MMSLLEVSALRAGYSGIPVVFGVDLEVGEAEVVALLGSNGSGKTTMLRAISGVVAPMAGRIRFGGADITQRPADRIARLGLLHIPQGRGIFPSLEVDETLRLAATLAGVRWREARGRVEDAYEVFPSLASRRHQAAGSLSGGEQQMLALARGLISRPRLLMIDEMSQGLAPALVDDLFRLLAGFPERGIAVLLLEQFVGRALAVANRAYVLAKGQMRFAGGAAELAADEGFVRSSYLGAAGSGRRRHRPRALRQENDASEGAMTLLLPSALVHGLEERARNDRVSVADLVRRALDGEDGASRPRVLTGGAEDAHAS
jgi:branched-chain amino acid transport system ATP-binding protein